MSAARYWVTAIALILFGGATLDHLLGGKTAQAISIALLEIEEADTSPNVVDVKRIILPNGSMTDDGVVDGKPQVTLDFGASGGTWTGAQDFSGADPFTLPSGTALTIDAAGEVAVDTSAYRGQLITFSDNAALVLAPERAWCVKIHELNEDDDRFPVGLLLGHAKAGLLSAACICYGTCTTPATVELYNEDGSRAIIGSSFACAAPGSVTPTNLSTGDLLLDEGHGVTVDVVGTTPNPEDADMYEICVEWEVTRE